MATKTVLCVTWNLELQCPDERTLRDSFGDYVRSRAHHPDIIVIGLQEATSYSNRSATFIGEKLVENNTLLRQYYDLLATERFKGITKFFKQALSHKANQVIQVLGKKGGRITAETEKHRKGKLSEKGFTFARVNVGGRSLGFISTHLSSDTDVQKKQREGRGIMDFLKTQAREQRFDAVFMMGDLNFRVAQQGYAQRKEGVEEYICTPTGRELLMRSDSFDPNHFNNMPFIWPGFEPDSLPTYKRKKDKALYQTIWALKGKLDRQNNNLKTLYPISSKKGREGYWDFGWLDRIGYACYAPEQYNGVPGLSRNFWAPRLKCKNPDVRLKVWGHIPYGDHAPVYCQFELDGF